MDSGDGAERGVRDQERVSQRITTSEGRQYEWMKEEGSREVRVLSKEKARCELKWKKLIARKTDEEMVLEAELHCLTEDGASHDSAVQTTDQPRQQQDSVDQSD